MSDERWFPFETVKHTDALTPDMWALLYEARTLLERLAPVRATDTSATVAPGDSLHLIVPLDEVPHASLQLEMSHSGIKGDWDDKHYLWDLTQDGDEMLWVDGTGAESRRKALAWLETQMHRPFIRRTHTLGRLAVRHEWEHTDAKLGGWGDAAASPPVIGFWLGFLPGWRLTAEEPAGYFDVVE